MVDSPASSRRAVLTAAVATLAVAPLRAFGQQATPPTAPKARPAPLPPELVRDFVGAGHGDLDKVKRMLTDQPGLLNATWDWGGGDFESAIGGAGHMGRADIAKHLIEQGARYDIFVAAMLGQLDFVKAALLATPTLVDSKGPHGISLARHAEKGGEVAKPVLEYLTKLKG
ncbi:MAG: ankyrin repeat domain-containing protein [Fimbriimonas sp.]